MVLKLYSRFLYTLLLLILSSVLYGQNNGSGQLLFLGDYTYPPYEYLDEEGLPVGFNVDIARAVAKEVGLDCRIELTAWSEVVRRLDQGEPDAVIGMYRTPARSRKYDFTIPHFMASHAVFVRKGSGIRSLGQALGADLILLEKDVSHDFVIEQGIAGSLKLVQSTIEALERLHKGEGEAVLVNRLHGTMLIHERGWDNLEAVGEPFLQQFYCMAVRKGDARLLASLNEGLYIIKTNGIYDEIYDKWFNLYRPGEASYWKIVIPALILISVILLILFGVILWNYLLRKAVSLKTAQLASSRKSLNLTLDSIDEAVISVDAEGRIVHMNHAAERITGWKISDADEGLDRIFSVCHYETAETHVLFF